MSTLSTTQLPENYLYTWNETVRVIGESSRGNIGIIPGYVDFISKDRNETDKVLAISWFFMQKLAKGHLGASKSSDVSIGGIHRFVARLVPQAVTLSRVDVVALEHCVRQPFGLSSFLEEVGYKTFIRGSLGIFAVALSDPERIFQYALEDLDSWLTVGDLP